MTEPLVSILSPAYRCARFLNEMIISIRAQTYRNWEILLVDDGSDDDQWTLMEHWAGLDARIRIRKTKHQGYAGAFNTALRMARGDIIARQDADDYSLSERLTRQVTALQQARADIVTCGIACLKPTGRLIHKWVTGMNVERFVTDPTPKGPGGAVAVATRKVYERVGGLDPKYELSGDSDWYFRLLASDGPPETWFHIGTDLYIYRTHPGQMHKGIQAQAVHRERQAFYRDRILKKYGVNRVARSG